MRRFAFGILHPLPIPMGLLETGRSAGIFPSESRSWRWTSEQQRPFQENLRVLSVFLPSLDALLFYIR